MRTCRFCPETDPKKFYPTNTTSGRAAGKCCRSCWIAKAVKWRQDNKEKWNRQRHAKALKEKFGVTQERFDELYGNPTCAGCGVSESESGRRLCFDHNHTTGKPRALLCARCNLAISKCDDRPEVLEALAAYLRKHQ